MGAVGISDLRDLALVVAALSDLPSLGCVEVSVDDAPAPVGLAAVCLLVGSAAVGMGRVDVPGRGRVRLVGSAVDSSWVTYRRDGSSAALRRRFGPGAERYA